MRKIYCVICAKYKTLEKPNIWYILEKSIICRECKNEDEKIFQEEESVEILKFIGLIENV